MFSNNLAILKTSLLAALLRGGVEYRKEGKKYDEAEFRRNGSYQWTPKRTVSFHAFRNPSRTIGHDTACREHYGQKKKKKK